MIADLSISIVTFLTAMALAPKSQAQAPPPASVTSITTEALAAEVDLLDVSADGRILTPFDYYTDEHGPDALIGSQPGYWTSRDQVEATTGVFGFCRYLPAARIKAVVFRSAPDEQAANRVSDVTVAVAPSPEGPFEAVAEVRLPPGAGLFRADIVPCTAAAVRFELRGNAGDGSHLALERIHVLEDRQPGQPSALDTVLARPITAESLQDEIDLADWSHDGRIVVDPSLPSDANHGGGLLGRGAGWRCELRENGNPQEIIAFSEDVPVPRIGSLVFRTTPDQESYGPRALEILATPEQGEPYHKIGGVILPRSPGIHRWDFPPVPAAALKMVVAAPWQWSPVGLERLHVLENVPEGGESVLRSLEPDKMTTEEVESQVDLISWRLGGRILAAPEASGTERSVETLLRPGPAGWFSGSYCTATTAELGFFPPVGDVLVGGIAFQAADDLVPEKQLRRLRVALAAGDGPFVPAASFMVPRGPGTFGAFFDPVPASRVRFEFGGGHGEEGMGLKRLHLFEYREPGRVSVLEPVRTVPIPAGEIPRGIDLASSRLGTRVEASHEHWNQVGSCAIDGRDETFWGADPSAESTATLRLDLPPTPEVPWIDEIQLGVFPGPEDPRTAALPIDVSVEGSTDGPTIGYRPITRFLTRAIPGMQRHRFEPAEARWVRLVLLRPHSHYRFHLSELKLIEALRPGRESVLKPLWGRSFVRDELVGRPNLASPHRGASIVATDPPSNLDRAPDGPRKLIDASRTEWGWLTEGGDPRSVVMKLAGDGAVPISTLVFQPFEDPFVSVPGGADPASGAGVIDITTGDEPGGPFQSVGRCVMTTATGAVTFDLAAPARGTYLKLTMSNGFQPYSSLGRVSVHPPFGVTLPPPAGANLLDPGLGGNLVSFTRGASSDRACLVIPGVDGVWEDWWNLNEETPDVPAQFVWGFRGGERAALGRLSCELEESDPAAWPASIRVESSDIHPAHGFRDIGSLRPSSSTTSVQVLDLAPHRARWVRLSITSDLRSLRSGNWLTVRLKRLVLLEDPAAPSVLDLPAPALTRPGEERDLAHDSTSETGKFEIEPNDTRAQAMPLTMETTVTARIDPAGDRDWFRYADPAGRGFDLILEQDPAMRIGLSLDTPEGVELAHLDPGHHAANRFVTSITSTAPSHDIRIEQPVSSLLMIFDSSTSMTPAYGSIAEAASRFFDSLSGRESVATALIGPEGVTMITTFTTDVTRLKELTIPAVSQGGPSDATRAIQVGLKILSHQPGNRALMILTDFEENGVPAELWRLVPEIGARLYTVCFAIDFSDPFRREILNDQDRYARNLAEVTGGRFLFAPSPESLSDLYQTVARDLATSPPYRIRVAPLSAPGEVEAWFEDRQAQRAAGSERALLILLDLSGSMKERVKGGRKIDIAKKVIARLIDELPEGMRVGLRVYGRRHSPKDPRTCEDRELMIPISPLDRGAFRRIVEDLPARGETPMIGSVVDSIGDFAGVGPGERTVVLVSDGIETCGGKLEDLVALPSGDVDLIRVDVVGFDIKDPATIEQLMKIAQLGHGTYHPAADPDSLSHALSGTTAVGYRVEDGAGKTVAEGTLGGTPLALPPGSYRMRIATDPPLEVRPLEVRSRARTKVILGTGRDGSLEVRTER